MQHDIGMARRNDPKGAAPGDVPGSRWSARRMIIVVSAISLLAWIVLIAALLGW